MGNAGGGDRRGGGPAASAKPPARPKARACVPLAPIGKQLKAL